MNIIMPMPTHSMHSFTVPILISFYFFLIRFLPPITMRHVCLFAIWKKEGKKEKPHGTNSRLRAWTALNSNHDGKARRLQGLLAGLGVIFMAVWNSV